MKQTIIVMHGALGCKAQLTPLEKLLKKDFHCLPLEFSGHGSALAKTAFGIEIFAGELWTLIHEHKLEKPWVFGYSMGGYVALYLESQYPGTFAGIVTLGTKFDWNPVAAAKEAGYLDPEKMLVKVPEYAQTLELQHGEKWTLLVKNTAQMMVKMGKEPFLNADKLAALNVPVQVSLGDNDKMVSIEETVQAFRALNKASLCILPDTPHPLEKVDAVRLSAEIGRFVRHHQPGKK